MSKLQFVTLALLFIGTQGAIQFAMQYVVPPKMPLAWEYRTYYMSRHDDGKFYGSDLSELGSQGWELVNTLSKDSTTQVCLLKRPALGQLQEFENIVSAKSSSHGILHAEANSSRNPTLLSGYYKDKR